MAAEIKTTFGTTYGKEISLREALTLENLHVRYICLRLTDLPNNSVIILQLHVYTVNFPKQLSSCGVTLPGISSERDVC